MTVRAWGLPLLVLFTACGGRGVPTIADSIPNISVNQQRTVTRNEFRWQWPFTVGIGTLGCMSNAVVFRNGGVSYALNSVATSRGFASMEPIWQTQSSGPPRDPLKRLLQHQRMEIFAQSVACEHDRAGSQTADTGRCKQRLREVSNLSEPELKQIEAEGLERFWPPLSPKKIRLDPLIDAGLKLCEG